MYKFNNFLSFLEKYNDFVNECGINIFGDNKFLVNY